MYRCAIREVQTKLEVLDDEFSVEYKRNPISFIKTRIKKPESIYRKLQKLGYDFTAENIQEQLNDVAGVRVVCAFIDDIYTVAERLPQLSHDRGNSRILFQGQNAYAGRTSDPYQRNGFLGYPGAPASL